MAKKSGDGIPIPNVIDPPESMQVTLCIPKNRDHMSAFFGALYQLCVWQSWQEDAAHSGTELAQVWWRYYLSWDRQMSDLECEDGMNNCCTPPAITYRVNPETGNVEISTNGGQTWSPAPNTIQSVIVQPVPPVTSGVAETKCDAATNLIGQVQVWIDQVTQDFDTAESLTQFATAMVSAILTAVLVILSAGALTPLQAIVIPLLGAALAAAWGAGKDEFVDYWSTEATDTILCAAYCNIGDDGSFTDAQFSSFWGQCNSELPAGPAKMLFMGFMSSVGAAGLNAMAASGMSANADCDDCGCIDNCLSEGWKLYVDTHPYTWGNVIATTEDSITVEAIIVPSVGGYGAAVRKKNLGTLCRVTTEMISGGVTFWGGNTDLTEIILDVSGNPITIGNPPVDCNLLAGISTSPFTIKFTFSPDEP